MPLDKGCSQEAFDRNVKISMDEGKPREQAVAIAFSTLRAACGVPKDAPEKMKVKDILGYGAKKKEAGVLFSKLFDNLEHNELGAAMTLSQEEFEALLNGLDESIIGKIRKAVGSKAVLLALLAALGGAASQDIDLSKPVGGKQQAVAALQIGDRKYTLQIQEK